MTKKLIEVALPLEAINEACKPETENPFLKGHPRAIHTYWARIPLVACRAVLFGSLVDDPSAHPDRFPTEESQEVERHRLFALLERLSRWDARNDPRTLQEARAEVAASIEGSLPVLVDPFAGRGSIPLEGARLGLRVAASDLNPVAALISKCLLDTPARFRSRGSAHPKADRQLGVATGHLAALSEDLRLYGADVQETVRNRVGHLYPESPDHRPIASWLWARTAPCQNPACKAPIPLVTSFVLSKKKKKEAWLEPAISAVDKKLTFAIRRQGTPTNPTKVGRGARFRCLVCGTVTEDAYVKTIGRTSGFGQLPMCGVVNAHGGRDYVPGDGGNSVELPKPTGLDSLAQEMPDNPRWFSPPAFGLTTYRSLFTDRQLLALSAISEAIRDLRPKIEADAVEAGFSPDATRLQEGGLGSRAYSEAIVTYLACALSRLTDYANALATWNSSNENVRNLFQRQAIPMVWDFAEVNIVTGPLDFCAAAAWIREALSSVPETDGGRVDQLDAASASLGDARAAIVSTDPPYYDNIGYADLSDFFYVWLRTLLQDIYPDLFSTLLTPKRAELVATPYRFGGSKSAARHHFQEGLRTAFAQMRDIQSRDFPITVFYAFRQEEAEGDAGTASTGWETMLEGLIQSGLAVTGTWPMRTTKSARSVARGTNALASAIVLVCRPRNPDAPLATRRSFVAALREELPPALRTLQQGNVAPVDLAQAAIGPGIGVFSRSGRVVEANGESMSVRTALALVNETLDEILSEQEGEFDADTRWAISWYDQFGFAEGPAGDANLLSNAKNTALNALVEAGIVTTRTGNVRLLRVDELDATWDPSRDRRLTVWEIVHHMVRLLDTEGEVATAGLLRKLGGVGDSALTLAYRLYNICQRRQRTAEGLAYNTLATAWPELVRLASATPPFVRLPADQLEL